MLGSGSTKIPTPQFSTRWKRFELDSGRREYLTNSNSYIGVGGWRGARPIPTTPRSDRRGRENIAPFAGHRYGDSKGTARNGRSKMKIKWNGHACFTITASDGTTIVTDPYEPGGFNGAIGYGPVDDRADVALISHDHADHNHPDSGRRTAGFDRRGDGQRHRVRRGRDSA